MLNLSDEGLQLSVISQGIAARYARRQASSEKASMHTQFFPFIGTLAIAAIEDAGQSLEPSAKL
jgi:hypothetical protein